MAENERWQDAERNEKGQFMPGNSGGPGRRKLSEIVHETISDQDWLNLFKKAKKRALDCEDPKAEKYFEILLDRAFGKVPQDINNNISGSISVESVVNVLENLRNEATGPKAGEPDGEIK